MSNDYRQMWAELGLDLKAHDALLDILGRAYENIFLSQKDRPKGMEYFNFVMSEVHGLRIKELLDARKQGRKVIGSFCVFVPEELVLAVEGVLVGLCAGAEFNFEGAETLLPRNTCSLIKSFFGFKLGKVCPYIESSDMIVGENTCDGKKKSYEIFNDLVKNLYVMDLPQTKSESGKTLLKTEYKKFMRRLEELSGNPVSLDGLKNAIGIVNRKRQTVHRLSDLRKADPAPISGLDSLLINQVYFYDDPVRFTDAVNNICDEIEERVRSGKGVFPRKTPRILVSGCPMAVPNWKLPFIMENSGAVIVGEESCVGERGTQFLTGTAGSTVDELLDNIVDRYFKIDCAVFSPNPTRLDHVKEMAKRYKADGVVHYNLQFCQPYQIETAAAEKALEKEGIPFMRIDTDYSMEDAGQLKTRIEAFIERIKA